MIILIILSTRESRYIDRDFEKMLSSFLPDLVYPETSGKLPAGEYRDDEGTTV